MRFRVMIGFLLVATVIAACQGPPPTLVYIVITATPETTEVTSPQANITVEATANNTEVVVMPPTSTPEPPTATLAPVNSETPTVPPTNTAIPTIAPTDLPPAFP